ncbi:MAG: sigma-70 family RNA polymerase sigma factor [Duncaniella sp.]|nr:sigma-70 family RNA polymerase sigma factor [Duncaniella sp.]
MQSFDVYVIYQDKYVSMDLRHLVTQCQSSDREAFGVLYQTYLIPMQRVVAYYVHNSDAVWDILHDGFLVAFVSIGSLKDASKIESWLASIMKNLALQYLKEETNHISVPLSDASVSDDSDNDSCQTSELTWEELDRIINKLPDGYGKVFRMAVLDGMSHKEIGAMLGIAPHSSSSQLAHAKAAMRRMITKYKIEIGALSIVATALLVWQGLFRHKGDNSLPDSVISKNGDKQTETVKDTVIDQEPKADSVVDVRIITTPLYTKSQSQECLAALPVSKDSVSIQEIDTLFNDTIIKMPDIIHREEFIAKENLTLTQTDKEYDWSLSLAYSGTLGQNDYNRYQIPNPDLPSVEGPAGEIEVTEKVRHYVPVVIALSLNRSITSRWSVETGIRYSFRRSDFRSESELADKETAQRIHYIGIPLKFNYHMLAYNGFSLYGQGGGVLDIPVYGTRSVWEFCPQQGTTRTDVFHIHAPLQWSVEGGLGCQYNFMPSFSIYAEPSFRYYFNSGSDIKTIHQDKPVEFTISIGLRLKW